MAFTGYDDSGNYWSNGVMMEDASQRAQPQALNTGVPSSPYVSDPTGSGPIDQDTGQPIQTHYNNNYFATDDVAQQLAQQYGGTVFSAPEREAGGGTAGSPFT